MGHNIVKVKQLEEDDNDGDTQYDKGTGSTRKNTKGNGNNSNIPELAIAILSTQLQLHKANDINHTVYEYVSTLDHEELETFVREPVECCTEYDSLLMSWSATHYKDPTTEGNKDFICEQIRSAEIQTGSISPLPKESI